MNLGKLTEANEISHWVFSIIKMEILIFKELKNLRVELYPIVYLKAI